MNIYLENTMTRLDFFVKGEVKITKLTCFGQEYVSYPEGMQHSYVFLVGQPYTRKILNRYGVGGETLRYVGHRLFEENDRKHLEIFEENERVRVTTTYVLYNNSAVLECQKEVKNVSGKELVLCAYTIVGISYFVYWDLTSILLSVVQIFVSEWTIAAILRKERYAVEVKVITKEPEKIREEILYKHRHSATILESKGMYSKEDNYMVVSVMNSRDIPEFMNTMKQYPDTFVYFSDGVRVQGDFHFTQEQIGERVEAYQ